MSLQALFPTLTAPIPSMGGAMLSPEADFEVLGLALDTAGLTETVQGLEGVTLFAPTDAAFAGLAQSLGYTGDPDDAQGVFDAIATALAGLAPDGDPVPLLTDILLYHVAPGATGAEALNAGGPVTTLLDGAAVQITGNTVVDGDPDAVNADIIAADIAVPVGQVQVVDQVLLPLDTPVESEPGTLLDVLKESGGSFDANPDDFDMLLTALQATGLDGAVDDPDAELTVFVPSDAAFLSLARDLGYEGEDEGAAFQTILDAAAALDPEDPLGVVTDILTYHVSPGAQDSVAVLGSDSIATLQGGALEVEGATLLDADPDNAVADIVATDIAASNGIAHVIDEVLLPVDVGLVDNDPSTGLDEDGTDEEETAEDDDSFDFGAILAAAGLFGVVMLLLA